MQKDQKKNIFHGILLTLVVASAFFSWLSIDNAIRLPGSSFWLIWFAPAAWFSVFAAILCLCAILFQKKHLFILALVLSFSLSLIFTFKFWHSIILLISILFASWGLFSIRNDLGLNVEINLWKSLLRGKMKIILAFAFLISSQYFFTISSMDGKTNMPRFDMNENLIKAIVPVLGVVSPTFSGINRDGLTVDQHLLRAQEEAIGGENIETLSDEFIEAQIPRDLSPAQREIIRQNEVKKISDTQNQLLQKNKELLLIESRKQFSEFVGQELKGDEKMSDVLAGIVSRKINEIMQPSVVEEGSFSSMLPLIFSLVLFITIIPLSSWVLGLVWFLIVIGLFRLFLKSGLVEVKSEMVEKESIQY